MNLRRNGGKILIFFILINIFPLYYNENPSFIDISINKYLYKLSEICSMSYA